jgi:8-oxo-dGTP pyrophosphatase MutT (NUDIX family)
MDAPELMDRDVLYRGKMITVHRDTLRQPDGQIVVREVVDHPDSVAVVALDVRARVLLLRQYRHPLGGYLWELPAGLLDEPGEPALEAARRELAEETGMAARDWRSLVDLHPSPGASGAHERDADEGNLETRWIALDEAVREVRAGEITNGLAVAGLLAAALSRSIGFTDLRPADV